MGRSIAAVVAGYVVIFLVVFASFTAAYLTMGTNAAFEPGTYEVSTLWIAASFVLGFAAAVAGGYACAAIAGGSKAPLVLAGVVLVLGVLAAIPVLTASADPGEPRPAEVSNFDAMQKARQPAWIALLNPVVGAAGVLLGSRLRGRR